MKYFILSDIHGSYTYLLKALKKFDESDCDQILILGDILYHGARNKLPLGYDTILCTKLLNEYANLVTAVRGNCDSEVDQMVLNFDCSKDYKTIDLDGKKLFLTHGHIDISNLLSKGDIVLSGHTHIKLANNEKDIIYLNPGSLSIPKDGMNHSYATIDKDVFKVFDVETDELLLEYSL